MIRDRAQFIFTDRGSVDVKRASKIEDSFYFSRNRGAKKWVFTGQNYFQQLGSPLGSPFTSPPCDAVKSFSSSSQGDIEGLEKRDDSARLRYEPEFTGLEPSRREVRRDPDRLMLVVFRLRTIFRRR